MFHFQADIEFKPTTALLPTFTTYQQYCDEKEGIDTALFEEDIKPSSDGDFDSDSSKFANFPKPKIVPVDYNRKKQICVCEQCGGSWSRKEYYYHHKVRHAVRLAFFFIY